MKAATPTKPQKTIQTEFYRTDAGGEPVREFLLGELTREERKAVGKDIMTVEYGWPIGMPVCKDLKNGLLEVRTQLDGKICRVLFSIYGQRMVLFHAFIKKSQAAPQVDMETALQRKKTMEKRK